MRRSRLVREGSCYHPVVLKRPRAEAVTGTWRQEPCGEGHLQELWSVLRGSANPGGTTERGVPGVGERSVLSILYPPSHLLPVPAAGQTRVEAREPQSLLLWSMQAMQSRVEKGRSWYRKANRGGRWKAFLNLVKM